MSKRHDTGGSTNGSTPENGARGGEHDDNMLPRDVEELSAASFGDHFGPWVSLQGLARRYHEDEALRARIDSGDIGSVLGELGFPPLPSDITVQVAIDSNEVMHVVLPPDPNTDLSDSALASISAGSTVSTAGTVGTVSSLVSSVACFSTVGSAGTVS